MKKVVYLANPYPAISHTFIFREICSLRDSGWKVQPVSVDRPSAVEKMSPAEQREAADTLILKNFSLARLLLSGVDLMTRSPWGFFKMVRRALSFIAKGPKSPVKAAGYLAEAILLLAWMKGQGIKHIHEHFANPTALVAILCKEYGGVSYSLSVHGPDIFYQVDSSLLKEKIDGASFIRCISHYCRSQVMRLTDTGVWPRAHIVRCGVDPEIYRPVVKTASQVPRLLCVGRLCPAKGQHLLLQACDVLRQRGLEFELVLVGDGPDRTSLEKLCVSLGLAERVIFRGAQGQQAVLEEYRQADVFVLPSFAEGVPVVLMEAMAMGKAVVSTRITGIPELIEHGEDGLLATPGDVEELARLLAKLLVDPEWQQRLGENGRRKVIASYNQSTNNQQLAALFDKYGE